MHWLHYFNNGQNVQNRFIFNVVSSRMNKNEDVYLPKNLPNGPAGGSSRKSVYVGNNASSSANPSSGGGGLFVVDHLSELFGSIIAMCQDKFVLIREVLSKSTFRHSLLCLYELNKFIYSPVPRPSPSPPTNAAVLAISSAVCCSGN